MMANYQPRPVEKTTVSEPQGISGRIAWHFEMALTRAVKNVFNAIGNILRDILAFAFEQAIALIEPGMISVSTPILNQMLNIPGIAPEVKTYLNDLKSGTHPASAIMIFGTCLAGLIGVLQAPTAMMAKKAFMMLDESWRSSRPDAATLWAMQRRGAIPSDLFQGAWEDTGWASEYISGWGEITRQHLDYTSLALAHYRKLDPEGDIQTELEKRGYSTPDAKALVELMVQIPPVQDLIHMAVRDAWNESAVREYGYDEDYPAEVGEWTAKMGIPAEWAKRYWRAHWQLPSVQMGYEMMHRGIITAAQLDTMLRISDIPRGWREKLIKMSYNTYTRVDVRRMYATKVLDLKAVKRAYLDIGYDDEHATTLALWTEKEYGEENRLLTKSEVLGAYQDDIIDKHDANEMLLALDYDQEEVSILMARIDLKKERDYEKEFTENIRLAFVGGVIDETKVIAQLNTLNPPAGLVESKLKLWRVQKDRGLSALSIQQLEKMFKLLLLDGMTTKTYLRIAGYVAKDQDLIIKLWTKEMGSVA